MAFLFHKKPIAYSARTLGTLLDKYKGYSSEEVSPCGNETKQYDELNNAVDLISGGMKLIKQSRDALQVLVDKLEKEFDDLKMKGSRKELVSEVEEIDKETQFSDKIAAANDLLYVLEARLNETRSKVKRLARKLDMPVNTETVSTPSEIAMKGVGNGEERESSPNATHWLSEDLLVHSVAESEDLICRTLKPKQLKVPRFYGEEEEFPEFWAIFSTSVHENKVLSTTEKMMFLRDSLKGKAEIAVKGIQLVPKNYQWMIETLQKKYSNKPTNRAKVVQKLVDMRPAANNAESCSDTYDKIRMLINQMVSAGQDIRKMQDALWTEKILEKFPYSIVKNVLMSTQELQEITIDDIMEALEKQIEAKKYVDSRLKNFNKGEQQPRKRSDNTYNERMPRISKSCVFCKMTNHTSTNCRTVSDTFARRNVVKEENLCWKCFSDEHSAGNCTKPNCSRCGRMHDISLCPSSNSSNYTPNMNEQNSTQTANNRYSSHQRPAYRTERQDGRANRPQWRNNHGRDAQDRQNQRQVVNNTCVDTKYDLIDPQAVRNREQIVFMTAEGNLWNHRTNQFEKVLFFFDTGAQKTLIKESTAEDFGLPTQHTELCTMSEIGGHTEQFQSKIVSLKVCTAFGKEILLTVQTKPVITNGFSSVRLSDEDKNFLQAKEMFICNPRMRGELQNPQILILLDYYYEMVPPNTATEQMPSGLHITKTVFGPSIHGKGTIPPSLTIANTAIHELTLINEVKESEILQKMYELEGLGISSEEIQKDASIFTYFQTYSKKLSFQNGVVTAPLPLKDSIVDLSDNYAVAYRRLMALWQLLQNNENQRKWYKIVLDKYIQESVIEVAQDDISNKAGTYYMPHSGVWRPSKAVPLRIVFDASSKRKTHFSLNDVVYTGESFVNKIHDVLTSSRLNQIVLLCDIEAAFTQIRLHHAHKDLCRFLWLKNADKAPTKDNIVEYRFTRLPFGLTASPSILNMVILAFLDWKNTPLAREIASHLYVDNILLKANSVQEALTKYRESKALFAEIGMNLREYISNSPLVNQAIPDIDRLHGKVIKFLGVNYDTEQDFYTLNVDIPSKEKLTKRDIVSQINSVYDPIGMAGPLLVKLKSLMREIYSTGVDWKEAIPSELASKWNEECQQINGSNLTLRRNLPTPIKGRYTLWVFSDASKIAIASCAYLQCTETRKVSQLISGKTRLTPKKMVQTIPRLELLSILIATRLAKSIVNTIGDAIEDIKIASDSEIALAWIPSMRKLPPFVASQRDRILRLKHHFECENKQVHFYHVSTNDNPADAGTRGLTSSAISNHAWIEGPQWLAQNPQNWSLRMITEANVEYDPSDDEEIQAHPTVAQPTNKDEEQPFIELKRFSNYNKLLRTVATIGKTLRRWLLKCSFNADKFDNLKNFDSEQHITAEDIKLSERLLIASVHHSISIEELQKRFRNVKVIRDEFGIIRHESRLQNAILPYDTKSPIFLPNPSELTRLILVNIHLKNAHCGNDHILALARQRYWIPQPMKAVKKYLRSCSTCKRCHGLPFGAPEMPSLPRDRVRITKPFQKIGCDFFGPIDSHNNEKMYVCLYTCLTTRAVHLEAVESLSTGAFLNSFVRFVSRRGVPQLVRTDCGTNFKLGQKIIETLFEKDDQSEKSVMNYSATEGITWIFNPPGAPWMGGVWERLVGSVKRSFIKAVGRRKLSFTELCTVMARIEAIINTRPLTKISSSDISEIPLRPIDFLQGNVKYALPQSTVRASDPDYDPEFIQTTLQAHEAMGYSEATAAKFWDRWNVEYLTVLRESQKRHLKQPRHTPNHPQIGEIVLIEQELIPRGNWAYGKIIELVKSADGLIRNQEAEEANNQEIAAVPQAQHDASSSSHETMHRDTTAQSHANSLDGHSGGRNPPRESKTRAYKVIQNFERSLQSTSFTHISRVMTMISLICLLSSFNGVEALSKNLIECGEGLFTVRELNEPFKLCVNNICKGFDNSTEGMSIKIPPAIEKDHYRINLTTQNLSVTQLCESHTYCDHSQTIMTISLLGNPHCWPLGVMITIAILIYATIAMLLFTIWSLKYCIKRAQRSPASPERNIVLDSFNPKPLYVTNTVVIALTLLSTISTTASCQHGFMRHTVDVVCQDQGNCSYEYNEEILFNRLQKRLCISVRHANETIGTIKITKKEMNMKCSKLSHFVTRDTSHSIFHTTRCDEAGSCFDNKCNTIMHNETIPELASASIYPGYSACEHTCGGILCGCLLVTPACSFIRVAHIPNNHEIYDVISCVEWTPQNSFELDMTIGGTAVKETVHLEPYLPLSLEKITLTIVSLNKPHSMLMDRRFAIAQNEALMISNGYELPVECETRQQAVDNFEKCANRMICACATFKVPRNCRCSTKSISDVRQDTANTLPINTANLNIAKIDDDIFVKTYDGELTLTIQSKLMIDVTQYTTASTCSITVEPLTGCYECQTGAELISHCKTSLPTAITVLCSDHSFTIDCDHFNKTTRTILHFDRALIAQKCHTTCVLKTIDVDLQGTLHYHAKHLHNSVFEIKPDTSSWMDTWSDIHFPDIKPLLIILNKEWKWAAAAIGAVSIAAATTYFCGPAALLFVVKTLWIILEATCKFIWALATCIWKMFSAMIAILFRRRKGSQATSPIPR